MMLPSSQLQSQQRDQDTGVCMMRAFGLLTTATCAMIVPRALWKEGEGCSCQRTARESSQESIGDGPGYACSRPHLTQQQWQAYMVSAQKRLASTRTAVVCSTPCSSRLQMASAAFDSLVPGWESLLNWAATSDECVAGDFPNLHRLPGATMLHNRELATALRMPRGPQQRCHATTFLLSIAREPAGSTAGGTSA